MARDLFQETFVYAQPDGHLVAVPNVEVAVYKPGTDELVTLYKEATGAAEIPTNPVLSGDTGSISFYAEVGQYKIVVHDTNVSDPKISDREFLWNAVPAATRSIPIRLIQTDAEPGGGIPLTALADEVKRQLAQVGQVIDWWRPKPTVPLPAGFEVCDGRTIAADAHDFGTGEALTLPDLRNVFILGASVANTDGAAATNGDGTAAPGAQHPNAPGIGGTGGSNKTWNFAHTHDVPFVDHTHSGSIAPHAHTLGAAATGAHTHTYAGTTASAATGPRGSYGDTSDVEPDPFSRATHTHNFSGGTSGPSETQLYGQTDGTTLTFTTNGADGAKPDVTTRAAVTWGATTGKSPTSASDLRPLHVGLLKLMKVRWN